MILYEDLRVELNELFPQEDRDPGQIVGLAYENTTVGLGPINIRSRPRAVFHFVNHRDCKTNCVK